jgi:hypothetical protein
MCELVAHPGRQVKEKCEPFTFFEKGSVRAAVASFLLVLGRILKDWSGDATRNPKLQRQPFQFRALDATKFYVANVANDNFPQKNC